MQFYLGKNNVAHIVEVAQSISGIASNLEIVPISGQTKMGQIWVNFQKKAKNHPGAARLRGSSFLSIFQKNSAIYTTDTAKSRERAGSIPQNGKRKPQVIKPGVFGCGGRI